jgi:hypothetical protein
MVEALSPCGSSYGQDRIKWPAATGDAPGARPLSAVGVMAVRHFGDVPHAQEEFQQAGLTWPARTLDMHVANGNLVARRHPTEVIVMGNDLAVIQQVLEALAPGRVPEAMAIDLSHALGVVQLHGPRLDAWLARIIDVSAIPAQGCASRCRLVDVPVLLLRTATECIHLLADRALFPYLADWLAFSHAGAFRDS